MTLQDTLPLNVTPELVRVTRMHNGRRVAVSGALPRTKAEKRLERLRSRVPDDGYELTPIDPRTTNTDPWRMA